MDARTLLSDPKNAKIFLVGCLSICILTLIMLIAVACCWGCLTRLCRRSQVKAIRSTPSSSPVFKVVKLHPSKPSTVPPKSISSCDVNLPFPVPRGHVLHIVGLAPRDDDSKTFVLPSVVTSGHVATKVTVFNATDEPYVVECTEEPLAVAHLQRVVQVVKKSK